MSKNNILSFISIFLFLYPLNYLTPMGFGDDYLYSFVWQGNPEFVPISEVATRITSFHDLFVSQCLHYVTWSGRTVNHSLAQFFLWQGKGIFNFCNAIISILLVAEIYYFVNKGKWPAKVKPIELFVIVFALWAFTPGFATVFLWLDGACNYLWTSVFLLGFLLPYVRSYYCDYFTPKKANTFSLTMFFCGILTGWTNENSICWIILVLSVFRFSTYKRSAHETWMYCGLAGLAIGYSFSMFAPGNIARLQSVHGLNGISLTTIAYGFSECLKSFCKVFLFQFLLWYYCLRTIAKLNKLPAIENGYEKDLVLVKVLCLLAFGMTAVMVFAPEFPLRSGFPGTVQLIIAAGILFRLQNCYQDSPKICVRKNALMFCAFYLIFTVSVAFYYLYDLHMQKEELLAYVNRNRVSYINRTLVVNPLRKPGRIGNLMSGFHIVENDLMENENSWENVAFARYYGIKGIRVRKNGE